MHVADYRAAVAELTIRGGAIVSGSFQGFDQSYRLDALARMGPGFVGVPQLRRNVSDTELLATERRASRSGTCTGIRGTRTKGFEAA